MPENAFFFEDEQGVKHDAEILNEFVDDDEAERAVGLRIIRDYVRDGNSLEEALELFGSEELQLSHADGKLTIEDIEAAVDDDDQ